MKDPTRATRRLAVAAAALLLTTAAAAAWVRVTVYFAATFDQKGAPGQQAPLVADPGVITVSGPGFSIVPTESGGGALLADAGASAPGVALTALFDKPFKGSELQLGWSAIVGSGSGGFALRALEENDGEIIDLGWDGGGIVQVDDFPVGEWTAGTKVDYALTLRDVALGADQWILTLTVPGQAPKSTMGTLVLTAPLAVKSLQIVVAPGATGTLQIDDLVAQSASYSTQK